MLNIAVRTVQNYLTIDVWQEVHEMRLEVINKSLTLVDRAVYAKAIKGDMTAAKILYKRWKEVKEQESFKDISINNDEDLEEIKRLEKDIKELEYDESGDP